jgi:hypothetical protein
VLRGDRDRKQHILFKPPNHYWGPSCGTESSPLLLLPLFSQPFHSFFPPLLLHLFSIYFYFLWLSNISFTTRALTDLFHSPPPPPPLPSPSPQHTGVIAGTVPFTDAQNQHSEERSRLLLMTSVDKRDARVRLDAAMQAVINKSASDVIKVWSHCVPYVLLRISYFTSPSLILLYPYTSLPPLHTSFPLAFHSFPVSYPTLP